MVSGTAFADEDGDGDGFADGDVERWVAADDIGEPYTGAHLSPPIMGPPISEGAKARPFTLRLDEERWRKLDSFAKGRRVTRSRLLRDLIDDL